MFRYSKKYRLAASLLAIVLLTGCTSPSDVIATTAAAKPLVTTAITTKTPSTTLSPSTSAAAPSATVPDYGTVIMPSGAECAYASGTSVVNARYPDWYTSVAMVYDSWQYPFAHEENYDISVTLPFEEKVAKGENEVPYLVKDEAVAEKIVSRIIAEEEYLAGADFPKMRGQQKYAKMDIQNIYINSYLQTVINNIASFAVDRNISLNESDGTFHWIIDMNPITFDLNTGDVVPLAALFIDGYDYKARLNEEIEAYLAQTAAIDESTYGNDYQLRLLAPFAGIRDDQPYCISGECLQIILDFNNPEIHMSNATSVVDIPLHRLSDCLALFDRYATEDVLTSWEPAYILTGADGWRNAEGSLFDFGDETKYRYATVDYWADGLTDAAKTAFMYRKTQDQFPLHAYKVMADADIAQREGYVRGYEQNVHTSVSGGYAVMTFTSYLWGFEPQEDEAYQNTGVNTYYCWNLAEDRPAVISDFFTEGFDYVKALEEYLRESAYQEKILEYVDSVSELIDTSIPEANAEMREDVLMLYPTTHGFSLRIPLSGADKWGELYGECGGCLSGYIDYSELGYENLTLFQ